MTNLRGILHMALVNQYTWTRLQSLVLQSSYLRHKRRSAAPADGAWTRSNSRIDICCNSNRRTPVSSGHTPDKLQQVTDSIIPVSWWDISSLASFITIRTADPLEEFLVWPAVALTLFILHSQLLQSVVDHQLALPAEALDATFTLVVGDGNAALVAVGPLQLYRTRKRSYR